MKKLVLGISREIKTNSKLNAPGTTPLLLRGILILVLTRNFFGLLPYVFTPSSHPAFTFVLAGSSWVGYRLYRLRFNPSNFLSHLVPRGTPLPLIPFIVLIELVRRVIRPLTLAVRLAANMVAGHLLLVLVRGPIPRLGISLASVAMVGVLRLMVLETGVSFIQGYVFISLSSLYIGEVNADNL